MHFKIPIFDKDYHSIDFEYKDFNNYDIARQYCEENSFGGEQYLNPIEIKYKGYFEFDENIKTLLEKENGK